MFIRILDCLRTEHDPKLILLAVLVSLISSFTVFAVLGHARSREGRARHAWSVMAACVAGGGIWSTHFVAMLGFSSASAVSYDAALTLVSAMLSIVLSGGAVPLLLSPGPATALAGAVALSAAIAAMHFTGMRALIFPGTLSWDLSLIAVACGSSVLLMSAAVWVERRASKLALRLSAAALFGAAICCFHFTAMAAASLRTDPALLPSDGALTEFLLGISVALVTSMIVILSLVTIFFDRQALRASAEADQMRSIIKAAQTGIVVCEDRRVIATNRAFEDLVGLRPGEIEGQPLANFITAPLRFGARRTGCVRDIEVQLATARGEFVDVALSTTPLLHSGPSRMLVELRDIRAEKAIREQLKYLADHDALTGLPNLRAFRSELRRSINHASASRIEFAVLWLDLDHFKNVNDTHGHAAGDAVLCTLAARFRAVLGKQHLLARVGGDEFVVICRAGKEVFAPEELSLQLLSAASEPIDADGKKFEIAISIGLAIYPHDADSIDELTRKADGALYNAKRAGRGRWRRAA